MTPDQLRELADWLRQDGTEQHGRAADYLRACADALETGPVAWMYNLNGRTEPARVSTMTPEQASEYNEITSATPLYPGAMPGPASATIERLRADAGRYQWIRDRDVIDWDSLVYCCLPTGYEHPDNAINSSAMLLDAAIDAAMKEERK